METAAALGLLLVSRERSIGLLGMCPRCGGLPSAFIVADVGPNGEKLHGGILICTIHREQ